jgi:hypothetical protein
MKKVLPLVTVLALTFVTSFRSFAQQTATDSIKQNINTFFNAMRKGDSTLLRSTLLKDMILQEVSNDKDGKTILSTDKADDLVKAIGTPHAAVYDERIVYDGIKIDGDLACVWGPAKFYLGDQFDHCGVDVFQLMRTADGWKVFSLVHTTRKDNCIQ